MTDDTRTDLVRRLREIHHFRYPGEEAPSTYTEAADEIERLRAELDRARPVIDAAEAVTERLTRVHENTGLFPAEREIVAAVRAYQDQEPGM